ncbi:LANO_0D09384g1_1 [Lachancea nothofagi CBS 11611]|uniref:Dolichyldiphosphatase n=1 Tax=Lachancea nothofagi CBS 11611 TaxID=1266666 RepID=A0A1G4JJF8_9SACH|nr:LANO_0D09384g1_1 [Lachancea nothofagi CBS 11611]
MNITELALDPILVPFDDTYILYDPSDLLSYVLVYYSLLPIGILIFYFSWFLSTRELEALIIAGGQVANELLNNIIKNIIKEARPASFGSSFQKDTLRSAHGMPSAHSQFMGFFLAYWSLKLVLHWKGISTARKFGSIVAMALTTFMVAVSRIYLGYHSLAQVSVGVALGGLLGSLFYLAVGIIRYVGLLDWLLSWRLCQMLWVKDSFNCCPLSLQDEFNAWKLRSEGPSHKKVLSSKKSL